MTDRHLSDDEMILLHYNELKDGAAARRHLESCESCRQGLEALATSLAPLGRMQVPERGAEYGAQVWERIASKLEPRAAATRRPARSGGIFIAHRTAWAIAAAMILMLAAGFLAGRLLPPQQPAVPVAQGVLGENGGERILRAAIDEHLQRSQRMLVNLANAGGAEAPLDVRQSQMRAEELLSNNRLYRQTATLRGDAAAAKVLDDLERALLEIARGPERLSAAQLAELQARLERQGVILKIRLYGTGQKPREAAPTKGPAA
jgi:hypothetical protein